MKMRLFGIALLFATAATAGEIQFVDVTPTFASTLKTRPANLTKLAANNHGQFPIERVKAIVTQGRPDTPAHGSSDMPVWGPIFQSLDPSDPIARARIDNVVAYLNSIQVK